MEVYEKDLDYHFFMVEEKVSQGKEVKENTSHSSGGLNNNYTVIYNITVIEKVKRTS